MVQYKLRDLFVEVTNLCLQGCVHCSSCAGPNNFQSIPIDQLRSLIMQSLPLGLESFTISGGEPLLYPDLLSLISFIRDKGLSFNLYTCGVCKNLDGELAPIDNQLLNRLVEQKINRLVFSLQGGTAEVHERVSALQGSFDITLQSIRRALQHNINVELHFVPMTVNYSDIEAVVQTANRLSIRQVSLLRLVPQGRCDDDLMLPIELKYKLVSIVESLQEKYPEVNIRLGAPFNCITLSGKECSAAKDKLLISATGEMFPCEAFKFLKGTRPKIYDSFIKDVWDNDKLLNSIRYFKPERIEHCNSCSLVNACQGGCHGQRVRNRENIGIGPEPDCMKMTPFFKEQ